LEGYETHSLAITVEGTKELKRRSAPSAPPLVLPAPPAPHAPVHSQVIFVRGDHVAGDKSVNTASVNAPSIAVAVGPYADASATITPQRYTDALRSARKALVDD